MRFDATLGLPVTEAMMEAASTVGIVGLLVRSA